MQMSWWTKLLALVTILLGFGCAPGKYHNQPLLHEIISNQTGEVVFSRTSEYAYANTKNETIVIYDFFRGMGWREVASFGCKDYHLRVSEAKEDQHGPEAR